MAIAYRCDYCWHEAETRGTKCKKCGRGFHTEEFDPDEENDGFPDLNVSEVLHHTPNYLAIIHTILEYEGVAPIW
jgi:hypothetical protein